MTHLLRNMGWSGRTALLVAGWAIAVPILASMHGQAGLVLLVAVAMGMVTLGAAWVVDGLRIERGLKSVASYLVAMTLLIFAAAVVASGWSRILA